MKHMMLATFAVAMILTPLAAMADAGLPQAPSAQEQAAFQALQQAHGRVMQLHSQARVSMLNALSPAHRNLLAQVVGQLAIAPAPDVNAAAKQIDSALSATEARTILSISSSLEQQTQQIMEAAHRELQKANPGIALPMKHGMPMPGDAGWRTDPGMILLHMAIHSVEPMPHFGAMMIHLEHNR